MDGVECCAEAGPAGAQIGTLAREGAGTVGRVGCVIVYCYDWHFGGLGVSRGYLERLLSDGCLLQFLGFAVEIGEKIAFV